LLQVRKRYRLLSGQQFSSFPDELQQYSRAFDASLASALEYSALVLEGEPQVSRTEVADKQLYLEQIYIEHLDINSLPDDLAMEWKLRFMLDQQIVELIENIEKTVGDFISSHLKSDSTLE